MLLLKFILMRNTTKNIGFAVHADDPSQCEYYEYYSGQEYDVILHAACRLGVSAADIKLLVVYRELRLSVSAANTLPLSRKISRSFREIKSRKVYLRKRSNLEWKSEEKKELGTTEKYVPNHPTPEQECDVILGILKSDFPEKYDAYMKKGLKKYILQIIQTANMLRKQISDGSLAISFGVQRTVVWTTLFVHCWDITKSTHQYLLDNEDEADAKAIDAIVKQNFGDEYKSRFS